MPEKRDIRSSLAPHAGRGTVSRNQLFEQALAAEKKGDLKNALEKYKMALQIDQNFFDAWLNAGAIYTRQGKGDKAITCYQRALVSKNDVRAHYNLAVEYYKKSDFSSAEKALKSVLRLDSRYLNAHLLLGYVFGKTGRNDKSEISIRNALKIDPQNVQAQTALALLYFHTDRPELALRAVNILLTRNPEDKVLLGLSAKINLSGGDLRAAARVQLHRVDEGRRRDQLQREVVADEKIVRRGLVRGDDGGADLETFRSQNVTLGAVGVGNQGDAGRAVGSGFDRLDLGGLVEQRTLEIKDAVLLLVTTALMTAGHATVDIATTSLGLGLDEGALRALLRDLGRTVERGETLRGRERAAERFDSHVRVFR